MHDISRYSELKCGLWLQILYQVLTSKKVDLIFIKSKLLIKTLFSNYEIIRRAAKKTVVGIYKVMYTVHCENNLRIEAIECINNESHD